MSDAFDPEALAGLEQLPLDDPRVRALGPRERAWLRAHREFVAPGDVPAGARVDDAERRLAEVLEAELGGDVATATSLAGRTSPESRDAGARSDAPRRGVLDVLLGPRLRPGLVTALVVVLAGGVWVVSTSRHAEQPAIPTRGTGAHPSPSGSGVATPRPRQAPAPPASGSAHVRVPAVLRGETAPERGVLSASVRPLAAGELRLTWARAPEAQSYTLTLLSPDLTERARIADLREPRFELRAGALPPGIASGEHLLWRVVAMRDGDQVGRTRTLPVTAP